MNTVVSAFAVSLLAAGSALASDKSDIMAVLKQWISGPAGTVATCADDAAVIDDLPPFEWHGPGACSRWQKDNDAYIQKEGITDATGTIGNPQQLIISEDHAYVVLPTMFSVTQKGKRVTVIATSTLVLHRTGGGWRITAWTWGTPESRADEHGDSNRFDRPASVSRLIPVSLTIASDVHVRR